MTATKEKSSYFSGRKILKSLDFAQHLFRSIGMRGEDQHHHLAALNGAINLAGKGATGLNIARCGPATDGDTLAPRKLRR